MLSRQVLRAAAAAGRSNPARAISTTAVLKSDPPPSLGDIEPDQQETFNSRQKKFRAQLAEAQKQREASAYSSPSSSKGTATALGSLSTAPTTGSSTTGNAAQAAEKQPTRKSGPLTNLIYGTKEGRELDAQIEASFSQVLARGKYVHSIVFHEVKPEHVEEYVKLVGDWYPRMASAPENKVHLVGSWRTEVGDCDTFGKWKAAPRHITHHSNPPLTRASLVVSPHLGIPALPRLPRLHALHLETSRISRLRP